MKWIIDSSGCSPGCLNPWNWWKEGSWTLKRLIIQLFSWKQQKLTMPWAKIYTQDIFFVCSVANTVVYLPNWVTLISSAAGQKLLGGWPKIRLLFIRLPTAALFSSNLPVSCLCVASLTYDHIIQVLRLVGKVYSRSRYRTVRIVRSETYLCSRIVGYQTTLPCSRPHKYLQLDNASSII